MQITLDRAPIVAAMARLSGVVARKHTIPILANVALKAGEGGLTLWATDLDMEALETIPCEVGEAGGITLPADRLKDIATNADPGAQIRLAVAERLRTSVVSGRSRYSVPALPVADYPEFPVEGFGPAMVLPARAFADLISRVAWSSDVGSQTSNMDGVYLAVADGQLLAMATEGSGIALRRMPAPEGAAIKAILPSKLAKHVVGWLGDAEGDVNVSTAEDRLLHLEHGTSVLTAKLYGGDWYDWTRILQEDHELSARCARDELTMAIRRVSPFLKDRTGTLRLTFGEDALTVRAIGEAAAEGVEEIGLEYEGPEATLLMNGSLLTGALGALSGDIVQFGFAPAVDPTVHRTGKVILTAPCDRGLVVNLMQPRA